MRLAILTAMATWAGFTAVLTGYVVLTLDLPFLPVGAALGLVLFIVMNGWLFIVD